MDLQVPILAAKALLLLLLFAFIYAIVRRAIGDLRDIPEDEPFVPGGAGFQSDNVETHVEERNGSSTLVVEGSDILAPNTRFPVDGGQIDIGRSAGSDIVLKSDDYVSGRHARLIRHGGLLYVEDIDSTNGTYVNGRKAVGATPLRSGDRVRVGSTTFRYSE